MVADYEAMWSELKRKALEQYREVTDRIGKGTEEERNQADAERSQVGSLLWEMTQLEKQHTV